MLNRTVASVSDRASESEKAIVRMEAKIEYIIKGVDEIKAEVKLLFRNRIQIVIKPLLIVIVTTDCWIILVPGFHPSAHVIDFQKTF